MSLLPLLAATLLAADAPMDVRHAPAAPKPGEAVLVTARLPAGAAGVALKLQEVAPGRYVRKSDPAYEKDWAGLPMRDDGQDGDAAAGDGVFTARVPGDRQRHRWLTRYRVAATVGGRTVRAPAADAAIPNFAWWTDAGPAPWTGSREPGKKPTTTYPAAFLTTLQPLTLVARAADVARSQWDANFHKQRQEGTVIYRGVAYDHVQYSNRGQGSAHIFGKNKWALKFGRHRVPFADHDGVPFPAAVDEIDLNPGGSTPYLPVHRGIAGLDEVLSMRAYRLAGVPAPPATWVQWRVVDGAEEVPKSQYDGDLWGLYVAVGDMDPRLLAEGGLPDGATVSIQSGVKHAPKASADAVPKQWESFLNGMRSDPPEAWWRANLDLPAYFSFHALNRMLGNVDVRPDGNHGYLRRPDGRWAPIPWDNDMMFVPRTHQPGHIDAVRCLNHPAVAREYRNRAREILDLFGADPSPRGGQVGQLAADLGAAVAPPGFALDWARLDADLWDRHPRSNQPGTYFINPCPMDHFGGPWRRTLATNDFAGFRRYVVEFCTDSRPAKNYAPNDGDQRGYGWGYLAHEARDDKIPATPGVERLPGGGYRFSATAFASPSGSEPAALEWRVGRVGKVGWYELTEHWKGEGAGRDVEVPASAFREPGEYRVRARWRDSSGRCGHWSAALSVASG